MLAFHLVTLELECYLKCPKLPQKLCLTYVLGQSMTTNKIEKKIILNIT